MATPRVFVSSTCYDLIEVRNQMKKFIEDYGFDPVMNEHGDIFFNYKKHVHDSCKEEIEKCHLFVLIIGNNYGSLYYDEKSRGVPDSVTLQEFKKSLDVKIFKHIFINRFVEHDFNNYDRARNKHVKEKMKNIPDGVDEKDYYKKVIDDFDKIYPFPNDQYRSIFHFRYKIKELNTNNAVVPFDDFEDIKKSLKKQWSGFIYEQLTRNKNISSNLVESINEKIDKIDSKMKMLLEGKSSDSNDTIKFDLNEIFAQEKVEKFEEVKEKIHELLNSILYSETPYDSDRRIEINEKVNKDNVEKWLNSLKDVVSTNKWSLYLDLTELFSSIGVKYQYYKSIKDISYKYLSNFYSLFLRIKDSPDDYNSFVVFLIKKFNDELYVQLPPVVDLDDDDDLPF